MVFAQGSHPAANAVAEQDGTLRGTIPILDVQYGNVWTNIDDALLTDATMVDWGLHDLMIDASRNELISDVYRINSLRVRLIKLEGTTLSPDVLLPAMEEHLWFLDAIKQRDPTEAARRLTHHIESAHLRVLGLPRPDMPWSLENPG